MGLVFAWGSQGVATDSHHTRCLLSTSRLPIGSLKMPSVRSPTFGILQSRSTMVVGWRCTWTVEIWDQVRVLRLGLSAEGNSLLGRKTVRELKTLRIGLALMADFRTPRFHILATDIPSYSSPQVQLRRKNVGRVLDLLLRMDSRYHSFQ